MTTRSAPVPWVARLQKVRVSYGNRTALHPVTMDFLAGTITVIRGPNGAGKSTLLEVVAGVRRPTAGVREMVGAVGFVPQRTVISDRLPLTVRDVVTTGTWGRLGPFRRVNPGERTGVDVSLARLGIIELSGRPFSELSGGQRQRTLLAQALTCRADLLLLDEPTTGLDDRSADQILNVIRAEADRGVAMVCVSHDSNVISHADHVVELAEGRVLGNPANYQRP